jgi:hypothetical protein
MTRLLHIQRRRLNANGAILNHELLAVVKHGKNDDEANQRRYTAGH